MEKQPPKYILSAMKEVRKFILAENLNDPPFLPSTNMCQQASYMLSEMIPNSYLELRGSIITKDFNLGHCWLEWNNYIIDVTGDQFNFDFSEYEIGIRIRAFVFTKKSKLKWLYFNSPFDPNQRGSLC